MSNRKDEVYRLIDSVWVDVFLATKTQTGDIFQPMYIGSMGAPLTIALADQPPHVLLQAYVGLTNVHDHRHAIGRELWITSGPYRFLLRRTK